MSGIPQVLGLGPDEAALRLEASGFPGVTVEISGRRREGTPRVIRQKTAGGKTELVVSYFKELEPSPPGPSPRDMGEG